MAPEFRDQFDPIELSDPQLEHDGLRQLTFHSPALRGRGDVSVFVPDGIQFPANLPLVILLHGVYGSHWSWFLKGAAHHTAQNLITAGQIRPMILATPSDGLDQDGSGYWPTPGRDAETWIAHDVPKCIRKQFPSRGATFLCGLSMGGYGALRIGFKYPGLFRGVSAHSAITRPGQMHDFVREVDTADLPAQELDILYWARHNRHQLPQIRFDCGREDSLSEANTALHLELKALGVPHTFELLDGGHEWPYWREHIASTLRFFSSLCD